MKRLSATEIELILEPSFRSTVESLDIKIPSDSTDLAREDLLKVLKRYNTRKVFRVIKDLIDRRKIREIVEEQRGEDIGANEIDTKIRRLVDKRLLLRLETPEMKLQISPTYNLLITPLGICFLYCYRKGMFPGRSLEGNISHAQELLGAIYEEFIEDEAKKSLLEMKVSLNKKEMAISILLLLSQALNHDKALKLSKSERQLSLDRLTKSLNIIGEKLFDESKLLKDAQETDNAIRRSTGVSGLEGKMSGLYCKVSSADEDRIYFKCSNEEQLGFIVSRLSNSVKDEEKKNDTTYRESVIELIDEHIRDRTSLFSPWIRRKFLKHDAETTYLNKLMALFKRNFL